MDISKLRKMKQAAAEHAQKAAAEAAKLRERLIHAALAGSSPKYFELMEAVVADPLAGAYAKQYERILQAAIEKGLIERIYGGQVMIRGKLAGSSGNSWYELAPRGIEVMRTVNGDDWAYEVPSVKYGLKTESAPVPVDCPRC